MIKEHNLLVSGQTYRSSTDFFVSWNTYVTLRLCLTSRYSGTVLQMLPTSFRTARIKVGRDQNDSFVLWLAFRVRKEQTQNTNTFWLPQLLPYAVFRLPSTFVSHASRAHCSQLPYWAQLCCGFTHLSGTVSLSRSFCRFSWLILFLLFPKYLISNTLFLTLHRSVSFSFLLLKMAFKTLQSSSDLLFFCKLRLVTYLRLKTRTRKLTTFPTAFWAPECLYL